jgi:dienelactone hydrolase
MFATLSRRAWSYSVIVGALASVATWGAYAAQQPAAQKSSTRPAPIKTLILPGEAFLVDGRPAFIFWPDEAKRSTPQPWIMYAPTLPGLPDNAEKFMHQKFLDAGVAVCGIDTGESYGNADCRKWMEALYAELTEKRGFATQMCLLGRSRGGLQVLSFAAAHPKKVAGIAGIYPVFDLASYPGLNRAAPAYKLTPDDLKAQLVEHNPIAKGRVPAQIKVPVFLIHGDVDKVVPLEANSAALAEHYKQAGAAGLVTLVVPKGQGHNMWEGFFRSAELIDFAIARAKIGAAPPP